MTSGGTEPRRHVVVFDCNVYLDIAALLGAPFSWEKFDAVAAHTARQSVPHPTEPALDVLRAVAVCTSGRFVGDETLEVWTTAHIDKVVRYKASQSVRPDPRTGHRGLGWSRDEAHSLVTDLIHGIARRSNGGTLGNHHPDGNPPLDHEDGMVYGACRHLASEDPLARIYCVTRDRGFVKAHQDGRLGNHTRVLAPVTFVALVRTVRSRFSVRRMRPT